MSKIKKYAWFAADIEKKIDVEEVNVELLDADIDEATKQKIQPQGKPLKPWKDKEVPISEDEIAAAISQWDANPKLRHAKGILDAKQVSDKDVKNVLGSKAGRFVTIDERPIHIKLDKDN